MKIDRNNYEEYFILYLDNELSPDERCEVEAFAKAHPDLQEELDMLLQSKLVPDHHIVFEGKEELFSFNSSSAISLSNYEEWLVLYLDNELTTEQRSAVEQFAAVYPAVQDELKLLLQTKSAPEHGIVFPDKELLYRREEKTRPIIWWRVAAAAALLVAVGTTTLVIVNRTAGKKGGTNEKIALNKEVSKQPPENAVTKNPNNPVTSIVRPDATTKEQQNNTTSVTKQGTKAMKSKTTGNSPLKNNETAITDNPTMVTDNTPAFVNTDRIDNTSIDADEQSLLTYSKGIINPPSVTTRNVEPLYTLNKLPKKNDGDDGLAQSDGKKGNFRGFLRKVTRTIEKKTNIDATDDDDRLLVGGLAIRL